MALCAIYVRTSIEKENTSINQQKNLGVKFCEKHNFEYQIYEDVGKSGSLSGFLCKWKISFERNPFISKLNGELVAD
jgi:hypothetical protein